MIVVVAGTVLSPTACDPRPRGADAVRVRPAADLTAHERDRGPC